MRYLKAEREWHEDELLSCLDGKVRVIQKWTGLFFFDFYTSLDRARRALQNCIFKKNLSHSFEVKI
jgi:hypothetical protein